MGGLKVKGPFNEKNKIRRLVKYPSVNVFRRYTLMLAAAMQIYLLHILNQSSRVHYSNAYTLWMFNLFLRLIKGIAHIPKTTYGNVLFNMDNFVNLWTI